MDFYYPCFREILNNTKKIEDVMADSTLQWILKELIGDFLKANLDAQKYRLGRGEIGLHLARNENVGLDIAVFDKENLKNFTGKYASVPPVLVVEIDVNVEVENEHADLFEAYILPKIERLLTFGTERFIWVLSKSQRVFIAGKNINWRFVSWQEEIEFVDGVKISIAELLKRDGIQI